MAKRKPPKKQLLVHHRHTGRVLARQHTSWPSIVFLLLVVGMLLGQITLQAKAADVAVTAATNGPLPPAAAVITSPRAGDKFVSSPITVKGTCPAPHFIRLYRNEIFSGSAQCIAGGDFTVSTDLFEGPNDLEARIYNAAGQEGPRSAVVTVTYSQDADPATPGHQTDDAIEEPFFITTDKFFKANLDKPQIEWEFNVVGGHRPMNAAVAWGDGTISEVKGITDSKFSASHVYAKSNAAREYYPVDVKVVDADADEATLEVFNILNYTTESGAETGNNPLSLIPSSAAVPPDAGIFTQALYAWPAYGGVTLMAGSFWLGEQQGFMGIRHVLKLRKLRFPRIRI